MAVAFAKGPDESDPAGRPEDLSDEDLLERFLHRVALESQDAFRASVLRHGPSVLAICRRVLDRDHDAEDASQATFLALARKGAAIGERKALAGWLREVAYRIAPRMRARAKRRRAVEKRLRAMAAVPLEAGDPHRILSLSDLLPILHEEVTRLPEKYRSPVVLSYLEGKTNEEVASLLRWPVGTVKGRLNRARRLLRSRLSRRGASSSSARPSW